jgi:hypothetical protein
MTDDLKQRIEAISTRVDEHLTRLTNGEEIDASGLDDAVKELCDALMQLPVEQMQNYQAPLDVISEKLREIEEALKTRRDEITAELGQAGANKQAQQAYMQSSKLNEPTSE